MERFANKCVLVTGAASGIGQAVAVRLAEEGADLAITDINAEGLAGTAERVTALGRKVVVLPCDVTDAAAVKATVEAAVAALGKLDVLSHNAGILRADHTHLLTLENWNKVIAVNLSGTFHFNQAVLPHLLATQGNIVNMCSTAALGSHPWMAAYAASKGGVLSLTRCLSVEYVKQGLRANCIVPGGIATPLHMQFRMPKGVDSDLLKGAIPFVSYVGPEHVASAVAFVASDDGRYMNGAEIRVDGGALS